jgi:hypothetical protein
MRLHTKPARPGAPAMHLEEELQRYLDYARAYILLDLAEGGGFDVADWEAEIGVVQDIEQFAAELKFFGFREADIL